MASTYRGGTPSQSDQGRTQLVASGEKYTICLVSRLEWRDLIDEGCPELVPLAELISSVAGMRTAFRRLNRGPADHARPPPIMGLRHQSVDPTSPMATHSGKRDTEENRHRLERHLYSASAFNVCEHQPFPMMSGPPLFLSHRRFNLIEVIHT